MKIEDKLLLIKDLSGRLPYGVHIEHVNTGMRGVLHDIKVYHKYDDADNVYDAICYTDFFDDDDYVDIEQFKPCLFPLSSMTEEQKEEYDLICSMSMYDMSENDAIKLIDFFHKNHLDYRGLIPKELAIDATGKHIYI